MPRKYDIDDKVVGTSGKFRFCKGVIVASNTTDKGVTKYDIDFEVVDGKGQLVREKVTFTKNSFRRFRDQDVQEGAQSLLHIGAKRTIEDAAHSSDEEDTIVKPTSDSNTQVSVGDLINQHILRPLHEHAKYQDKKVSKATQDKRINARVTCVVCNFIARSYCVQCSEASDCIVAVHNPFPVTDPGDMHRATSCYISHITAPPPPDK